MLNLTRRRRRSIYSLSAKGGEVKGYMGFGPKLCADRYRTSAGVRSSGGSWASGRPVVSGLPLIRLGCRGTDRPVGPVIRSLGGVAGRPVLDGRPLAVA